MNMTTSVRIYQENEGIAKELIKTRELSKIINEFLRQYREKKGISFKGKDEEIEELKEALEKKEAQYEALKKEVIQ